MNNTKATLVLIAALLQPISIFAQGSLTPPGGPTPSMKSLDQIEPRTPIDANHTPGGFLASYIISQPGSYYLTSNIVGVSGKRGIEVDVANVTIDLCGFSLTGVSGSFDGIYSAYVTNENVIVRNGNIRNWGNSGVNNPANNGIFEQLSLSSNLRGITCGGSSIIQGCIISSNIQSGIFSSGNGNVISRNICTGNNTQNSATHGGIYAFGNQNRIEANHVTGSGPTGYGIYFGGLTSIVIQNTVIGGSGNNYSPSANNVVGPLISAVGTITNSNPWANFSY